jgi:hypothetical protein
LSSKLNYAIIAFSNKNENLNGQRAKLGKKDTTRGSTRKLNFNALFRSIIIIFQNSYLTSKIILETVSISNVLDRNLDRKA